MKTLLQLSTETVLPDGGTPTENQENEIAALVQFGERVLLECSPTKDAPDRLSASRWEAMFQEIKDLQTEVISKLGGR